MCNKKHSPQRKLLLILTFFILNSAFYICTATVRFVSHNGSNTPPYTSWATAADSIMSAINISVFGDTIYVANGVYEEQVIMIPGLTLIGAGMDSCVIAQPSNVGIYCIVMDDNCTIDGFNIEAAHYGSWGFFVNSYSDSVIIRNIIIPQCGYGIYFDSSGGLVENCLLTDIKYDAINQNLFWYDWKLSIINNVIETKYNGIKLSASDEVTIISNFIFLSDGYIGIHNNCIGLGIKIFNNLIVSNISLYRPLGGLNLCKSFQVRNNFIYGEFQGYSVWLNSFNTPYDFINNVIMNGTTGLSLNYPINDSSRIQYNDFWDNNFNYEADSTNLFIDPMIVSEDSLDFHLQMFSPLIDAGDPNILDIDGGRSDIGLYGGPWGESYTYLDIAPRPPVNLTAKVDSNKITVSWNRNTEADFSYHSLFRDTTANFNADSTTFIFSLADTFYTHIIPEGVEAFYYKLTATDNQGNQSLPSEELAVLLTTINEYPMTISGYKLYQNYPNPFNPSTKIGYRLKERGYVKLYIYDVKGELIELLVNQYQEAGYYEVEFYGEGKVEMLTVKNPFASGFYICQIIVQNEKGIPIFFDMKKMILLK